MTLSSKRRGDLSPSCGARPCARASRLGGGPRGAHAVCIGAPCGFLAPPADRGLVRGAGGRAGWVLGDGSGGRRRFAPLGQRPKASLAPSGRAAAAVGARLGPRARWWG